MKLLDRVPCQPARETPCELAFLAEAPSVNERLTGIPLCPKGNAGRIFAKLLSRAGIKRADCWVGNVFDAQLPGNDLKNWCCRKKDALEDAAYYGPGSLLPVGGSGFLCPEFAWHFDRLAGELRAAKPKVIVTLGATGLWALTGRTTISKMRGALTKATRIVPGTTILPTFHPQYCAYRSAAEQICVEDYSRALAEARGGYEMTPRELWLRPSLADILTFKQRYLDNASLISVDIETGGHQITEVSLAPDPEHSLCIPFADKSQPDNSYWRGVEEELAAWELLRSILSCPIPKLFQYGVYDCWWFAQIGIRVMNWREDTRLQSHARSPEEQKDLAYLASRFAKIGPWKLLNTHDEGDKRDA